MSIHYKFKSSLDFDTITFDGLHISVSDLKQGIVNQKRLGKLTDFDLHITNAQTKEVYFEDSCLIPKNTSLVIARVPIITHQKKVYEIRNDKKVQAKKVESLSLDIFKMRGSEEDKIQAMMLQSTAEYDPMSYVKIKGQSQTGDVPPTYRCNKCKKGGHWIKNCSFGVSKDSLDVKRNTGIPKSFRDKEEKSIENEMKLALPIASQTNQTVPDDLVCSICNDIFMDAVMIPCCGSSFCDDCVRTALLESDENECPDCKEKGSSPGSLIPNRFLRNSVNNFKNETGYKSDTLKTISQQSECKSVAPIEVTETEQVLKQEPEPELQPEMELKSEPELKPESKPDDSRSQPVKDINDDNTCSSQPFENESDFEDNITVKMPFNEISTVKSSDNYAGKSSSHTSSEINNMPFPNAQVPSTLQPYRNVPKSSTMSQKSLEWDPRQAAKITTPNGRGDVKVFENIKRLNVAPSNEISQLQPINTNEIYPMVSHRINTFMRIPTHTQDQSMHQQTNFMPLNRHYNDMTSRVQTGFPHFNHPNFNNPHGYISHSVQIMGSHQMPSSENYTALYDNVAAKVGTGVIDDPLEAFNRIMKEKEKKREERWRSPDINRSRSKQYTRFRPSPPHNQRDSRTRENEYPSKRDHHTRTRYDKERRNRDVSNYQRRSNSFSDRSSRSRSNSMHKNRQSSPYRGRRSRTRNTHTYEESRDNKDRGFCSKTQAVHSSRKDSKLPTHELKQQNYKLDGKKSLIHRSTTPHLKGGKESITLAQIISLDTKEPPPPGFESGFKFNSPNDDILSTSDQHENVCSENKESRDVSRSETPKSKIITIKAQNCSNRRHDDLMKKMDNQSDHNKQNRDTHNREIKTETSKNASANVSVDYYNRLSQENDNLKLNKKEKSIERVDISQNINSTDSKSKENKSDRKNKERKKKRKDKIDRKKNKKK